MAKVHVPPSASQVEAVRSFINERFRRMSGQTLNVAQSVAQCALDQILVGNYVGANVGIGKLDGDGARDFRACLKSNGIELPAA